MKILFTVLVAALTHTTGAHADALLDPTRPPLVREEARTVVSEPALRVEAIMRSNDRMVAIVNGKLVRAGDRVGSAVFQTIETDRVRYASGGRSHEIKLPAASIKVRGDRAEVGQ